MSFPMKKIILLLPIIVLLQAFAFAQLTIPSRLKVYIDCSNTWCDFQHIRSEINIVDYMHDNSSADVHVLITSQGTGSGGNKYDIIFYGQHDFKNNTDTLNFVSGPDATENEQRDLLLKYIKAGLIPFIAKTAAADNIEISLKTTDTIGIGFSDFLPTKDPWNAWVIRIGANLYANADANYNNQNYSGNFSAYRITDKTKLGFGTYYGKNKSTFEFEADEMIENFIVNNHNWAANHYLIKSISSHCSWSYDLKYSQNTFSNNKGRAFGMAAVEYNIFPYKDVNHKLFTLSYGLTARRNQYYDTTIYNKTEETLYGHRATAYLSLNQKWGNTYAGISYHNYFNNWQFFNLGVDVYTSVRVAGGLSFYLALYGALTRDQVFLVKGNATPEEVLARRRQLASGYNYFTSVGINYRFGSKTNNVVNPRFDRSSYLSEE